MKLLSSMSDNFKDMYSFSGQFVSIILTTIVICTISIIYNVKIRNADKEKEMSGFLLIMESIIKYIEGIVTSIMGKKFRKLTPYAMYIMFYIFISSLLSLMGIESATTSYTVTLSMGFVTFIAIYYFGLKYQKLSFFNKFKNPIELFTQFTPLISISFRLFGNLLGGSIILGLIYSLCIGLQGHMFGVDATNNWINHDIFNVDGDTWDAQYTYFWTGINIFTTILTPLLHLYFDLFDAAIQCIVFTMLTFSYWAEAMGEEEEHMELKEKTKNNSDVLSLKTNKRKTISI